MNIQTFSLEELIRDREESILDIRVCESAMKVGVYKYSGGWVKDRLEVNRKIVEKIDAELKRRKAEQVWRCPGCAWLFSDSCYIQSASDEYGCPRCRTPLNQFRLFPNSEEAIRKEKL